jgi:hypothetical protein
MDTTNMYYSLNLIKSSKPKKKKKNQKFWDTSVLLVTIQAVDHLFFALKRHDTRSNYKQFLGAHIS